MKFVEEIIAVFFRRVSKQVNIVTLALLTAISATSVTPDLTFAAQITVSSSSITSLASQIASLSSKAHDGGLAQQVATPILTVLSEPTFDWNQVLFGTDTLTSEQQLVVSTIEPSLKQLLMLQDTTQTEAVSTINALVAGMQSVNSSVSFADALSFLQTIVDNAATEMFSLAEQPATTTAMQTTLHVAFRAYVNTASPDVQAVFPEESTTTGTATGGSGGATGANASGSTGSATSGGTSSTSSSATSTGTTSATGSPTSAGSSTSTGSGSTAQGSSGGPSSSSSTTGEASSTGAPNPSPSTNAAILTAVLTKAGGSWSVPLGSKGGFVRIIVAKASVPMATSLQVANYHAPKSITLPNGASQITALSIQMGAYLTKPAMIVIRDASVTNDTLFYQVMDRKMVPLVNVKASKGIAFLPVRSSTSIVTMAPPTVVLAASFPKVSRKGVGKRAIYANGHLFGIVPAIVRHGTTFVPMRDVIHLLHEQSIPSVWNGHVWDLSIPANRPVQLNNLHQSKGLVTMALNGQAVSTAVGVVALNPDIGTKEIYISIASVMQLLSRISVKSAWNGHDWMLKFIL